MIMHDGRSSPCDVADLVEQHYDLLYRYAFRLSGSAADAEDLAQQTFLTAQARLSQLRDPQNARAWLCTILRHQYLKTRRPSAGAGRISLDRIPEPTDETPEELLIEPDELQAALDELPEEFRTPIVLFYFGEFSYKEIADQMDMPVGTVMSRLARAKGWLRKRLTGCVSGSG
jgi:RNA polymerase sigma-70 factor, ECF subfamily